MKYNLLHYQNIRDIKDVTQLFDILIKNKDLRIEYFIFNTIKLSYNKWKKLIKKNINSYYFIQDLDKIRNNKHNLINYINYDKNKLLFR